MPDSPTSPEFVGRTAELAAFEHAIEAARDGVPAVLLIGGEAGIGKTTLIAESARRTGTALVVGRCLPMAGEVIPLAALADLLRDVTRRDPAALVEHPAPAALRRWAAEGSSVDGTVAGALFAPLLELVAALGADGAIVVAFEDLHWADPLTWDLFDFLGRNLVDEHVVLVGTYRANQISAHREHRHRLGEVARLPVARRILLGGLSRDELATKIEILTGEVPRADLVDQILARGEGNPFFTTELVAAHLDGQAIPIVLSDLIASDLDTLDDTGRSIVAAIAVVGHDVTHDLLARVVDFNSDTLERGIHAAIDAQLVVVNRDSDAYRLRHALIGEVLYDELLPPERKRLHRRIADALADPIHDVPLRADDASEIAFHLDRAGDHAAAFTALLSAADVTESVAPASAYRHLERALELWDIAGASPDGENRGDRLWQAAELASGAIGNEAAAGLAREAFRWGEPSRGTAWGHERLGRYLRGAGQIEQSATEFSKAAELLADGNDVDAARVFAGLAQAELMLGQYDVAEARAQHVFELLDGHEVDPAAWAMARRVLGIATDHAGDPDRGVALCREAVEMAPDAQTELLAVLYLGVSLLDAGRYRDAVNDMLDASTEARLTGLDRSFGGYVDALAAEGLIRLGRWSEAETVLRLSDGAEAFPLGRVRLAFTGATLWSRRGERDRAKALLAAAAEVPIDSFHRRFLARATAETALALAEWAEAATISEHALVDTATSLWQARFVMYSTVAEVELALDAKARREPVDIATITAQLLDRIEFARRTALAARGATEALDTSAHLAQATAALTRLTTPDPDAWSDAADHWAQLGDPYWLATARLGEADAAAAVGEISRAADAMRRAHHGAVELGAVALQSDIEAVSRRTRISLEAPVNIALNDSSIDQLGLTPREAEVLSLVAMGQTNRQIGEALFVSEKTASVHVSNIMRKLGVTSRVDAAAIAQRLGAA